MNCSYKLAQRDLHLLQRLQDILQRIGKTQPQVALAISCQRKCPGSSATPASSSRYSASQLEDLPEGGHVGKDIERALRHAAAHAGDGVQPGDQRIPRGVYSATTASTGSCGPSIASIPATWVKLAVQPTEWVSSSSTRSASASGMMP